MPNLSYRQKGLSLKPGTGTRQQILDLQRDLRALGYLRAGVDGVLATGTSLAIKALQYDLLHNHGGSRSSDGNAPVAVADYNHGRVEQVTGIADPSTVECVSDILDDSGFPKLPFSNDAPAENRSIVSMLGSLPATKVPIPFLLAILKQESGLQHFCEPTQANKDSFIVVGLDTNAGEKHIVTSRGYGVGQYTLFHHPPRAEEVDGLMRDPAKNVSRAVDELRNKFDHFVNGKSAGTTARDRVAEIGLAPLRICKFSQNDPRFLRDCAGCMKDAGSQTVRIGDPLYGGSSSVLSVTRYYKTQSYIVPRRPNIPCDWPYAVRRYNGDGVNSYHYQFRILQSVSKAAQLSTATAGSGG